MRQQLLAAGLCLVVAGCGASSGSGGGSATGQPAANATFNYGLTDDLGSFDPYRTNLSSYQALAYDSLVNVQPDGSVASGLAEKWQVGTTSATFTLRSDVSCSDGTPLKASDVATALSWVSDPKNKSVQLATNLPPVPFTTAGDDQSRTVRVTMSKPFGLILRTIGNVPIVCPKGISDPGLLAKTSSGTGPYVLTDAVPGQSYSFEVRKDYTWGPGGADMSAPGTPAKVVLKVVTNETTRANLLLSGELNFARVGGDDQTRLLAQGMAKADVPNSGAWLWLNQLDARPTTDKRVRQALVHALDIPQIVKVNTGNTGSPATGLVNRAPRPCADDTLSGKLPAHDAAAAESLLDEAGWTKGPDGVRQKDGRPLTLDIHYVPGFGSSFDKPTAELIAEQWKAIGVQSKLTIDSVVGFSKVVFETSNYDVYLLGFGFDLPTQAVNYVSGPVPPDGRNLAGIQNPAYTSAATKAASLMVPDACTYWNQAEQALWNEVNPVPLATRPWLYFVKNAQAQVAGTRVPIPTSLRVFS